MKVYSVPNKVLAISQYYSYMCNELNTGNENGLFSFLDQDVTNINSPVSSSRTNKHFRIYNTLSK